MQDPGIHSFYETSKDQNKVLRCLDCKEDLRWADTVQKILFPAIDHKEIVFDLDHTLFHCELKEWDPDGDFEFTSPDGKWTYVATKRPGLEDLMKNCLQRFEKNNFFTAATDWYAHVLIDSLNLPSEKIGFIKTRKHTFEGRPLSFERELLKPLNNSFVVEDKPLVIQGKNNRVFKIQPFYKGNEDKELERLWKSLKNLPLKSLGPRP